MSSVHTSIIISARDTAIRTFERVRTSTAKLSKSLFSLQNAFAAVGGAMAVRAIFQAGVRAETLERAFKAVSGSVEGARDELDFLRQTSDDLGLSFYDTAEAYKGLFAAARGTSLEGEGVRQIFLGVSEAVSALGLSAAAADGMLTALTQMMSKGVVMREELVGQFGERLPGALQIAAQAMGVTTAKLNEMLEGGEVAADVFELRLGAALREQFGRAAKENAQGAAQAVNRFQTAWTDLQVELARSGFLDAAVEAVKSLGRELREPETRTAIHNIGQGFARMAGIMAQDLIPRLDQVLGGFNGLVNLWGQMPDPMKTALLTGAAGWMVGGPVGAVAGTALGTGWSAGNKVNDAVQEALEKGPNPDLFAINDPFYVAKGIDTTVGAGVSLFVRGADHDALQSVIDQGAYGAFKIKAALEARKLSPVQAPQPPKEGDGSALPAKLSKKALRAQEQAAQALARALSELNDEMARLTMNAAGYEKYEIDKRFDGLASALAGRTVDLGRLEEARAMAHQEVNARIAEDDRRRLDRVIEEQMEEDARKREIVKGFEQEYARTVMGQAEAAKLALRDEYMQWEQHVQSKVQLEEWYSARLAEIEEERRRNSTLWSDGAIRALEDYGSAATDWASNMESVVSTAFKGMEDALTQFVMTGKMDFRSLADSIIADISRIAVRQLVTGALAKGLSMAFGSWGGGSTGGISATGGLGVGATNAHGNIYDRYGIVPFAAGGIVDRPTIFPFARGIGLMGEAGPEAILPLTRTRSGDLGVRTEGGDSGPREIKVEIINRSGNELRVSQSQAANRFKETVISIVVDAVNRDAGGLRSVIMGR